MKFISSVSMVILLGSSVWSHADSDYSPYVGKNYPTRVLWGDTHLHTAFSPDAFFAGNKVLTPEDAFRLARGEEVQVNEKLRAKLSRPLDFLVVADHAEFMGVLPALKDGSPEALALESGQRWRDLMQGDGAEARKAEREVIMLSFNPDTKVSFFKAIQVSTWEKTIELAERTNQPGTFTAFAGFEWSSMPNGNNLHRIVMFRDGADKLLQVSPYSAIDSENPEDLWKYMADYEGQTGGEVLAIPHNSNLSNGLMFSDKGFSGEPLTQEYAEQRKRWEPVVEAAQIKGDSESHTMLSPNDEFADYGTWDYSNLVGTELKRSWMLQHEYVRSALKLGLKLESELGTNPYEFGMIGSTDSHTSLPAVEENDFWGKAFAMLPDRDRVNPPVYGAIGIDTPIKMWQQVASGYAGVWATENTREGIFDAMQRREVYATTGPRMTVRFFGGWNFSAEDITRPDYALIGYANGVPMGGELPDMPNKAKAPVFMVSAVKDPMGANLDRIQIVKGWLDRNGETHEKVYDVAWSGDRKVNRKGKLPPVGNTVDLKNATYQNSIGSPQLATCWFDPDFSPEQSAFYYVRILEIPTPTWVAYDRARLGTDIPEEARLIHQERAYSSPIWHKVNEQGF